MLFGDVWVNINDIMSGKLKLRKDVDMRMSLFYNYVFILIKKLYQKIIIIFRKKKTNKILKKLKKERNKITIKTYARKKK